MCYPIPEENRKEYLAHKHEVMAFAYDITNNFKKLNFNRSKILNCLKYGTEELKYSNVLTIYKESFEKDDATLKLLYKYIYMYLDE